MVPTSPPDLPKPSRTPGKKPKSGFTEPDFVIKKHRKNNLCPYCLALIGAKKGICRANKDFSSIFSAKFRILKLKFLAVPRGPGGFGEVREAGRNHFHLSWYISVPGITLWPKIFLGDLFCRLRYKDPTI